MKRPRRTESSVSLAKAVDHPIRLRALSRLNAGEVRSPGEIAQGLSLSASSIAYRFRVLPLCGAAKVVEDSPLSMALRCESVVAGDRWAAGRLVLTEAEDEATAPLAAKRLRRAR